MHDRISSFLDDFKVGTLLAGSGIRKLRGAKPLTVFTAIFSLPFGGANFSRGIVHNQELGFQKDLAFWCCSDGQTNGTGVFALAK